MKFSELNVKDLIVRIKGKHCEGYDYGIIKSMDKSLSYYPINFRDYNNRFSFYYQSNSWLGRAARSYLDLPEKYIWRTNSKIIRKHEEEIENLMEDIMIDYSIEWKIDLYINHAAPPYVLHRWKNRVWPIDESYLDGKQKKIRDLFLERGDFS